MRGMEVERRKGEIFTSRARVAHTTARQIMSRRGEYENGREMYKR